MNKILRIVLTIVGMLSLILAVGFCSQLPWVVWLWPWADTFSPYLFLGSIAAATAASLLWIGLSGELRSAAGGALHLTVFYAGLASSLFLLSQHGGRRVADDGLRMEDLGPGWARGSGRAGTAG